MIINGVPCCAPAVSFHHSRFRLFDFEFFLFSCFVYFYISLFFIFDVSCFLFLFDCFALFCFLMSDIYDMSLCDVLLTFIFHLQASRRVDDLFEDLRDGHNLLSLLEVLSGERLVSVF